MTRSSDETVQQPDNRQDKDEEIRQRKDGLPVSNESDVPGKQVPLHV